MKLHISGSSASGAKISKGVALFFVDKTQLTVVIGTHFRLSAHSF